MQEKNLARVEETPDPDWSTATPAQKADEAARLYAVGWTYKEIAERLDYANASGAYKAVQRALVEAADKRSQPNDLLRVRENARLDMLIKKAIEVMNTPHYATNNHGVIYAPGDDDDFVIDENTGGLKMDEHGNYVVNHVRPMLDDGPALDAIRTALKVMERMARLNGLDAPTKRQVITLDAIEAEIQELEKAMRGNDG